MLWKVIPSDKDNFVGIVHNQRKFTGGKNWCNKFSNFHQSHIIIIIIIKGSEKEVKKQTSSVYDCTVKDVEYICNILR